ncbi:DUF6511 domain-containing protein [Aureimonas ureilytica]|uniref:DUF6511 domain-containing protein n=1 Tax=Aureimonas ureilytica TaxID=401562 RepID=UPI00036FB3BD|nr:DUF6511 domain-containing protein [Aureimonas ureilytica]
MNAVSPDLVPDICHCCGFRAEGAGLAPERRGQPFRWFCKECLLILDRIRDARRLDAFEEKAIDGGVEAVGVMLTALDKFDLSEMSELEAREIVKVAWKGCADRLRELLREGAPF